MWLDSCSVCVLTGQEPQGEEHQDVTFHTVPKLKLELKEVGLTLFLYSHLSMKLSFVNTVTEVRRRVSADGFKG